jgi:tRNA pseudouridine38-40 synthase
MRNVQLIIAYDGTEFHGWQAQAGVRTVQGVLAESIAACVGHPIELCGASRTDAHVHARGQSANFLTRCTWPEKNLHGALNSRLPDDLAIVALRDVDETFRSQAACGKHYQYRIWTAAVDDPLTRRHHWWYARPLEPAAMQATAALLVGTHDFRGLQVQSGKEHEETVRELHAVRVSAAGEELIIDVLGRSFMYKLVRSLVGLLVAVGRGHVPIEHVPGLLAGEPCARRSEVAPPHGLTLMRVFYAPEQPRL